MTQQIFISDREQLAGAEHRQKVAHGMSRGRAVFCSLDPRLALWANVSRHSVAFK
jgi:hypothetical protein